MSPRSYFSTLVTPRVSILDLGPLSWLSGRVIENLNVLYEPSPSQTTEDTKLLNPTAKVNLDKKKYLDMLVNRARLSCKGVGLVPISE